MHPISKILSYDPWPLRRSIRSIEAPRRRRWSDHVTFGTRLRSARALPSRLTGSIPLFVSTFGLGRRHPSSGHHRRTEIAGDAVADGYHRDGRCAQLPARAIAQSGQGSIQNPGAPVMLGVTEQQKAELLSWSSRGQIPATEQIVRQRGVDLQAVVATRFGVHVHVHTISR
jgi:hypothetical protein